MSNYQSSAPKPAKTILEDPKLRLTARPLVPGSKPPSLHLGFWNNNPQLVVYPNADPNNSNTSVISAHMDMPTLGFLEKLLRHVVTDAKPGSKFTVANKRDIPKEKRTDPKVTKEIVSETLLGKDEDGRIWIAVNSKLKSNAPKVKFFFQLPLYHDCMGNEQADLSPALKSQLSALAWCDLMHSISTQYLMNKNVDFTPPENKPANNSYSGGGNKGGYQQRNNNSGSAGSATSSGGYSGAVEADGDDWD